MIRFGRVLRTFQPTLTKSIQPIQLPFQLRHSSAEQVTMEDMDPEFVKEYGTEVAQIIGRFENRLERRQSIVGTVVSTKCAKSITVLCNRLSLNKKYNKLVPKRKKFMAHDEESLCKEGDVVRIVPCRPMSRRKRHAIKDILMRPPSLEDEFAKMEQTRAKKDHSTKK